MDDFSNFTHIHLTSEAKKHFLTLQRLLWESYHSATTQDMAQLLPTSGLGILVFNDGSGLRTGTEASEFLFPPASHLIKKILLLQASPFRQNLLKRISDKALLVLVAVAHRSGLSGPPGLDWNRALACVGFSILTCPLEGAATDTGLTRVTQEVLGCSINRKGRIPVFAAVHD